MRFIPEAQHHSQQPPTAAERLTPIRNTGVYRRTVLNLQQVSYNGTRRRYSTGNLCGEASNNGAMAGVAVYTVNDIALRVSYSVSTPSMRWRRYLAILPNWSSPAELRPALR